MKKVYKKIIVNDKMQKNYKYEFVVKMGDLQNRGKDERGGNLPSANFHPDLTPKEMLELGVFGGLYMTDCMDEFPKDWFYDKKGKLIAKFTQSDIFGKKRYDKNLNFFKVKASQSLKEWQKKGWIHKDDPRGWFQWYCRYYMGRRHPDDERQIKRWQNMKRHILWLQNGCGVRGLLSCRPRQRQALLHWAYDSRKL